MTEMEIPQDIKQTATRFAGEYLAHEVSCERLYQNVAALLLAERERCADIADAAEKEYVSLSHEDYTKGARIEALLTSAQAARAVAAAIRKP